MTRWGNTDLTHPSPGLTQQRDSPGRGFGLAARRSRPQKKPQPTANDPPQPCVLPVSLTCSTTPPLPVRIASPPWLLGWPGPMKFGLRYRPLADFRARPFSGKDRSRNSTIGSARQPRRNGLSKCGDSKDPGTTTASSTVRHDTPGPTSISRKWLVPAPSAALQTPTPQTCHRRYNHTTKTLPLSWKGSPYPSPVSSGPGQGPRTCTG